jgi:hypothetical protein
MGAHRKNALTQPFQKTSCPWAQPDLALGQPIWF